MTGALQARRPEAATLLTHARQWLAAALRPRGKLAFVRSLPQRAKVLDVGCGNNSPREFKTLRPDLYYAGLDVGDYNQQGSTALADAYIVTPPERFAGAIREFHGRMDAIVSAHNLEHCDEPDAVLDAMLAAVRPGGRIYLAFPCEESVNFPRRRGTLNFFDDATHRTVPRWDEVVATLRRAGFEVQFSRKRYRPWALALAGLMLEPVAALMQRNLPGGIGWALYGFESVIWAERSEAGRALP